MENSDSMCSSDPVDSSESKYLFNRYQMTPIASAVVAALAPGNAALAQRVGDAGPCTATARPPSQAPCVRGDRRRRPSACSSP